MLVMTRVEILSNIKKTHNDIWDLISDIHDGEIANISEIKTRLVGISGYVSTEILIPSEQKP